MPQGTFKSKVKGASKPSRNSHASDAKKSNPHRIIKPKNATLAKQQKITKKHSGSLTGYLEKKLAEKAGHVEMIGKRKRNT